MWGARVGDWVLQGNDSEGFEGLRVVQQRRTGIEEVKESRRGTMMWLLGCVYGERGLCVDVDSGWVYWYTRGLS